MSQSGVIATALLAGFLVYLAAAGRLNAYLSLIGL
jgi:hypothetical protein